MPRHKLISDEQIKHAAREVFMRDGPAAPVGTIARTLGVSTATLFFRVKSKDALLKLALWPADPDELVALRADLRAKPGAKAQLLEILTGLSRYLAVAVPATFLLHAGGFNSERRKVPPSDRIRTELAGWLDRARTMKEFKAVNPKMVAETLMGTLEARYMHLYLRRGRVTHDEHRQYLLELIDIVVT